MTDIKKTIQIAAPIEKVWAALTNQASIGEWMGDDEVKIDLKIGGKYAVFSKETTGKFTEIDPPTVLEYTWRQSTWEKIWPDSLVRWELKKVGDSTQVNLTHDKFPNAQERDSHDEGWDLYWLDPMQDWLESEG